MTKLEDLLRLNRDFKIEKSEEGAKILFRREVIKIVENNEDVIYDYITSLKNVTLYIPKVYIKE